MRVGHCGHHSFLVLPGFEAYSTAPEHTTAGWVLSWPICWTLARVITTFGSHIGWCSISFKACSFGHAEASSMSLLIENQSMEANSHLEATSFDFPELGVKE